MSTDVSLPNVALNKSVTMSSVYSDAPHSETCGTDGVLKTHFSKCTHTEINDENRWWMVDLDKDFVVQRVHILNRDTCGNSVTIWF